MRPAAHCMWMLQVHLVGVTAAAVTASAGLDRDSRAQAAGAPTAAPPPERLAASCAAVLTSVYRSLRPEARGSSAAELLAMAAWKMPTTAPTLPWGGLHRNCSACAQARRSPDVTCLPSRSQWIRGDLAVTPALLKSWAQCIPCQSTLAGPAAQQRAQVHRQAGVVWGHLGEKGVVEVALPQQQVAPERVQVPHQARLLHDQAPHLLRCLHMHFTLWTIRPGGQQPQQTALQFCWTCRQPMGSCKLAGPSFVP